MDNANEFAILFEVYLPMNWGVTTALSIVCFIWTWNAFLWPFLAVTKTEMMTVTVGITQVNDYSEYIMHANSPPPCLPVFPWRSPICCSSGALPRPLRFPPASRVDAATRQIKRHARPFHRRQTGVARQDQILSLLSDPTLPETVSGLAR